jgi:predicted transcriptional regulator
MVITAKIFASTCRVNMLKILAKGETNIMDLVHKTNSTWLEVDRNIKFFESLGIVETTFCKNRRLIKLNKNNAMVESILKALRILEMTTLDQLII